MSNKDFEVVIDRRLQNRFLVRARSQAEAAMQVGQLLARTDPYEGSGETVIDTRMGQPKIIKTVPAGLLSSETMDALRRGETPPGSGPREQSDGDPLAAVLEADMIAAERGTGINPGDRDPLG